LFFQSPTLHLSLPQVLRSLSGMILARVLPPDAQGCLLMRGLLRELVACCVLRNTLMYLKPYSLNKVRRGNRQNTDCL
jgi:hypothetical protein